MLDPAIARPIAQKAHDATFPTQGCLRRLSHDLAHVVTGDYVPFICYGCRAEFRVSGLEVAKASTRLQATAG